MHPGPSAKLSGADKAAKTFVEQCNTRPLHSARPARSMDSTNSLLGMVGTLYEAALEPTLLPAALTELASTLRARDAQLHLWDRATGSITDSTLCEQSDPSVEAAYVAYYGVIDPWRAALQDERPGIVLRCHHRFDDTYVAKSEFYQEFCIPAGKRWTTGTHFEVGTGVTAVLSVRRQPDESPYEDWTERALLQLTPHFRRAALLRRQLGARARTGLYAEALMLALPSACALLDAQGRILTHNEAARSVLAALSGKPDSESLQLAEASAQLAQSIGTLRAACRELPQTVQVASNQGGVWRLHLIPLNLLRSGWDDPERGMALAVFESSTRTEAERLDAARTRYQLTAAQAAVLAHMLQGRSVKRIAADRDCSVDTVRAHVKAILERTGFHSQRELVAALARS